MAHKRRRSRLLIFLMVLVLCLGGAVWGISKALRPSITIDPSKLAIVERGNLARSVVATGKIEPLAKVEVKSKASGIVKNLYFDYGDLVKKGQIIAELDKEALAARVREAQAALQSAEAAKESAMASCERNKVEAEGPDVPFLKSNMKRAQDLYKSNVLSATECENAEKEYQMALNKQNAATRGVAVSKAEINRAEAEIAKAQATLEQAEEDLRNSTIVSPMDGIALSRNVEVGDAVSSILVLGSQATLVATLGDISSVYVKGKVDEADIGKVYLNQESRIVVESFKDKKFQGQVTKISPLGAEKDNVTTFEVRVSIQNPGGELKANMTANAEIILEEKKDILLIPETSILYDKDRKSSVEIADSTQTSGKRKVPIEIGISNGVKTELVQGLKEGQEVVLQ